MTLERYAIAVMSVLALSLGIAWASTEDARALAAAAFGGALAAGNTILAYHLAQWSQGRSNISFMTAILGGMLVRMTVMLTAVLLAALLFTAPMIPLVISLLVHFVLFLVFEVMALSRQTYVNA